MCVINSKAYRVTGITASCRDSKKQVAAREQELSMLVTMWLHLALSSTAVMLSLVNTSVNVRACRIK